MKTKRKSTYNSGKNKKAKVVKKPFYKVREEELVESLRKDLVPWQRDVPFHQQRLVAYNAATGKSYGPANEDILANHRWMQNYIIPIYASFKQLKKIEKDSESTPNPIQFNLKGAKAVNVIKMVTGYLSKADKQKMKNMSEDQVQEYEKSNSKEIFCPSPVFAVCLIPGSEPLVNAYLKELHNESWDPNHLCERMVQLYTDANGLVILHDSTKNPQLQDNNIIMPDKANVTRDQYYCTLFFLLARHASYNYKLQAKNLINQDCLQMASEIACGLICNAFNVKKQCNLFYKAVDWITKLEGKNVSYVTACSIGYKLGNDIIDMYDKTYRVQASDAFRESIKHLVENGVIWMGVPNWIIDYIIKTAFPCMRFYPKLYYDGKETFGLSQSEVKDLEPAVLY